MASTLSAHRDIVEIIYSFNRKRDISIIFQNSNIPGFPVYNREIYNLTIFNFKHCEVFYIHRNSLYDPAHHKLDLKRLKPTNWSKNSPVFSSTFLEYKDHNNYGLKRNVLPLHHRSVPHQNYLKALQ